MGTNIVKPRLLIADDDEAFSEIIKAVAEDLGFAVTLVHEGSQVVDVVADLKPHVISLDLCMPGADGVEVIRALSNIRCKAGIILMSGMDERTIASVQALGKQNDLNISATFTKPVSIDVIEQAIMPYVFIDEESPKKQRTEQVKPVFNFGLEIYYEPELQLNPLGKNEKQRLRVATSWRTDDGMLIMGGRLAKWSADNGMGKGIFNATMEQVCQTLRAWKTNGFTPDVIVPVSLPLLHDLELPDFLSRMVKKYDIAANRIGVEVHEQAIVSRQSAVSDVLSRIRIKGFRLSVRAKGEGENILTMIDRLPIDQIVVDMSELRKNTSFFNNMELEFQYSSMASVTNNKKIEVCASDVNNDQLLHFTHKCKFNSACGREIAQPTAADRVPEVFAQPRFGDAVAVSH
jgi:EAL domain-containing protein (putative c-di-GMP-specific phosphodiesterase class I)